MTAHDHRTIVPGCFRCELGQDEGEWVIESIAKEFHGHYERLAPTFGYATRDDSSVPWGDVPNTNRALMRATVRALLDGGIIEPGDNI